MKLKQSVKNIALAQKISRISVWKIKKKFEKLGDYGLKDHKPGHLFEPLNPKFYDLIVESWKRNKCGARKLYAILKKKGFSVSRRKISQVMIKEGFQKPCIKRQKPRKYKSYEWPIPNIMWHTDWHIIKAPKLKGMHFISYIDDCSRKIMAYGVFEEETTKNSLLILYKAIAKNQVTPYELNSDRGAQFIQNKYDKTRKENHEFQKTLEELGIIFIPSKRRHPQTNGKLEKFHDILDKEFDERFKDIEEFIEWYNNERASEALDYDSPNESYKKHL